MNESNGPVNTNSNNGASTGTNTNTNTVMNPNANTNMNKAEVKKPENEVKKPVMANNNAGKDNAKAIERSKSSAVAVVIVLLILVGAGYYIKKARDNRMPSEQPAAATEGLTLSEKGLSTGDATDITSTSANLHATITGLMDTKHFKGQSTYFKYGTSATNPNTLSSFSGAVEGELTTTIKGLRPDTTYYYRVVINHGPYSKSPQREYGDIKSFKTLGK